MYERRTGTTSGFPGEGYAAAGCMVFVHGEKCRKRTACHFANATLVIAIVTPAVAASLPRLSALMTVSARLIGVDILCGEHFMNSGGGVVHRNVSV